MSKNSVNSGEVLTSNAEDNPEPSLVKPPMKLGRCNDYSERKYTQASGSAEHPELRGNMKQNCSKCGQPKEFPDAFPRDKKTKSGHSKRCKDCAKLAATKYYEANKEERLQYGRLRGNNPQKMKIYSQRYHSNSAKFKLHSKLISFAEHCEELANGDLGVKCAYCGELYVPTIRQVRTRMEALNGKFQSGESRFYCCEECKDACPIYNQTKYYKGQKKEGSSREVQPELRQMVFLRDNYTCQTCENHKSQLIVPLHCHHNEGIRWEPLESADIDRCSTQCETCHREIHTKEGCRYVELRCKENDVHDVLPQMQRAMGI